MGISGKRKLCVIILIVMTIFISPGIAESGSESTTGAGTVSVDYFYTNACDACQVEEEFLEELNRMLGYEKENIKLDIRMYNIFHTSGIKKLEEYMRIYSVPENKQGLKEYVFINGTFLAGRQEIDRRLLSELVKAKASVSEEAGIKGRDFPSGLQGEAEAAGNLDMAAGGGLKANGGDQSVIVYFYVNACASCREVEDFLERIDRQYNETGDGKKASRLLIRRYNISEGENTELIRQYFNIYKVPESSQKVPVVFIGESYLQGVKEIQDRLAADIEAGYGLCTLTVDSLRDAQGNAMDAFKNYQALGVFFTGLVNGFNPCSLSMLLFFLSMLLANNKNVLKLGASFIAGKLLAYFLLGTLLYNLLGKLGGEWFSRFQGIMKVFLLVIAAVLIVMNIRDYIAAKKERYDRVRLQLPAKLRKWNHQWIKKLAVLKNIRLLLFLSFCLGILISAGEFLCTGQIYLATIIYVIQSGSIMKTQAALYFLLYSIALVTPLAALTLLIHKGREILDVSEAIREKLHIIKLANAAVFLIFALIILFVF